MRALKRSQTSSSSNSSSPSSSSPSSSSSSSWIHLRSVLFVVASSPASSSSSNRGHLKSPWSRRKRKRALAPQQWRGFFTPEGKLRDGGVKFLKKVRSGGVDPSIRAEVWPFLLGVYELNSSKEERDCIRNQKRREYESLRRDCRRLLKRNGTFKMKETGEMGSDGEGNITEGTDSPDYEDVVTARESLSSEDRCPYIEDSDNPGGTDEFSKRVMEPNDVSDSESSDSDSSADPDISQTVPSAESMDENTAEVAEVTSKEDSSPSKTEVSSRPCSAEDFGTWQRIIRLDAIRANAEWIAYSPSQAVVSESRAHRFAEAVGLKDYEHLEPPRILHAARLVSILEAYALYDPEIGYCQGMSDLLSPIITVMTEDHEAFWCFVGFMKKARHNFRLDEVGIRRQLNIISKIIKHKDSHLYRHLEKLQAEDCFFVYRMVVVLFRRELTFEQTLCIWEVMWADQAAIRAGIGKSAWSRIRLRAPPTDDLLLYAIAASVLQRRKQIIEKYSSMDEILRECQSMAGQLDVWKLLDDAHDLVVTLHEKI
ncbi:rab GTPase-activating protein 22 isoform X2 [Nicotiana tabacum]|uniref:Rab GTPase-activating protein 22 isoform X2 n=2 Tax=Nicotiana tabacum TaxID=4097 RepID=A0AC58UQB1_TOBAC|nr:PREDICTED: GTPase-activating protein gyp7-like isoform X2 [Nicotiana tabacum]